MKKLLMIFVLALGGVLSTHAELNYSIDLTSSGYLRLETQRDPRWGVFAMGPSNTRVAGSGVNIARCGCLITSLSMAAEAMDGGGLPWFAHNQFSYGGLIIPAFSLSPKYIDDYFNTGPAPLVPRAPGWGYSSGGGVDCGVNIWPWAATGMMDPIREPLSNAPITPTGLTWDTLENLAAARNQIDAGLAQGLATIVGVRTPSNTGHANLIVGWDNTQKKYLIFDPMWGPWRGAQPMGTNWPTGVTADEKYSNYVNSIELVMPLRPVINGSRWLLIKDDPEPIELRMTDPRGRRTGHDPSTGKHIQDNTSAFYSEFTSWADPLGILPEAQPLRYIAARDPEAGLYGLEVFGTGNGPFTLSLETVQMDQPQVAATITGNIVAGETKRYEITYSSAGSLTYIAVPAFSPRAKAGNDFTAYVGNTVAFDGRGSQQIAGTISYAWDFGDGSSANGAQPTHSYSAAGVYNAILTVTNMEGLTASDSRLVTVVVPGSQILKETIRVSVTGGGLEENDLSWNGAQGTPDGRYVTFISRASNLVADDTNGEDDVFVKDLLTGAVQRVSISSAGVQSNSFSSIPSISADGRFVAFVSAATSLVAGFSGNMYVHDRVTGTTEGVSQTFAGQGSRPSLSGDGRYIAFTGTGGSAYVRDRQLGTVEGISVYDGNDPRLSADGRFVTYSAGSGPDDVDPQTGTSSIYLRDRQTGTDELISRSGSGTPIPLNCFNPSISSDGRFVSFAVATNTFPSQRNVFVRDRILGTTEQINIGTGLTNVSFSPAMDASGRYVAFISASDGQSYLRDRQAATTEMVSVATDGTPPAFGGLPYFGIFGSSWFAPSVTSTGSVVFPSNAPALVSDDTNGVIDIFIRRLVPGSGTGSAMPIANLGGPYLGWAPSTAVPAGIRLDGSGSLDPNGAALTGHWDFGDGSPAVDGALVMTHAYAQPGIYQVTLTVNSGGAVSAAARTEVEVLPALPADGISVGACSAKGGTIPFDGAAAVANATLIANGWDTSSGPVQMAPVTVTLPWGQIQTPTTLPGLTFKGVAAVPLDAGNGGFTAAVAGGPSATFNVPCAVSANLPPLAVAGGPIYMAQTGIAVNLNGSASSDPENSPLSYRWEFGDGTTGTGVTPLHTYAFAGTYFVTLIVNDGSQDSAQMIGTRSFAMVSVTEGVQLFPFEGFFAPVDNLPVVNLVQAGSAIPLKFALGGDRGLDIFAAGYPKSQTMPCDSTAPLDGIEQTVTAGSSSLTYDAATGRYHYVWKTEKSWSRTCRQLVLKFRDGSVHTANFKFK